HGTSAVSAALSKCSIWSTISTCWRRNRERWQVHGRCGSGANADAGRRVSTALAELARTARQAGGHAGDDRVTHARQALRVGSAAAGGGKSSGLGLHGCGRGSALADGNGTESSAQRVTRTEWTGTLRTTIAADERVRPVTKHRCQHGGGGAMKEQTQALEHASV